jgi:integrase
VAQIRAILGTALEPLVERGDLPRNVATLARPPEETHEASPLTPDEARRFLRALAGWRFETLYTLAFATGLRFGEVTGLRWEDVNLRTDAVHLRVQLQWQKDEGAEHGQFLLVPLKGKLARQFDLPGYALAALTRHEAVQRATRTQVQSWGNVWNLCFTMPDGRPIHQATVRLDPDRLMVNAKIVRRTPHDLRRSCGSLLALMGATPFEVQRLLGRSNIAVTSRVYIHE